MSDLPDDYFLDADDELVDFLEKQGEDCIREITQSNSLNKENGYKLLSILIVGIGSSFLLLTQKDHPDFLNAGVAIFTLYWTLCAVYLVLRVLSVQTRALISTSPDVLYTRVYKTITGSDYETLRANGYIGGDSALSVMRRYRLKNLCQTASELQEANIQLRTRLTRVRLASILTPALSITVSALVYFSCEILERITNCRGRITSYCPSHRKIPWWRWRRFGIRLILGCWLRLIFTDWFIRLTHVILHV